jgi:hypothetical protein
VKRVSHLSQRTCRQLSDFVSQSSERRAARLVIGIIVISCLVKALYAWRYYGFYSGDDVEIHEMVFAAVLDWDWQAWSLRSAFYPMVFLYPAVAMAQRLGVEESALLVYVGRLVVVGFSGVNIWLVFKVASRAFASVPVGILAALFLALNKLHASFATTVFPRTVSTTFVLLAVWFLLDRPSKRLSVGLAGIALGAAAAVRFSEAIFIMPALIHLVLDKRSRDALLLTGSFLATASLVVGVSDAIYWGEPFSSAKNITAYTLSWSTTRGHQPFYHYFTTVQSWSDWLTIGLVLVSLKLVPSRLALWAFLPLLLLSLLPHKESRYLLPAVPFFVMLAAAVFWHLLKEARGARSTLILVLLVGMVLMEVTFLRFRSSEGAVDAARYVASRPHATGVVVQRWTSGGRLYLWRVPFFGRLTQEEMEDRDYFLSQISPGGVSFIIVETPDLERLGYERMLEDLGYQQVLFPTGDDSDEYRLFGR